jgi:hypothetical protein
MSNPLRCVLDTSVAKRNRHSISITSQTAPLQWK